MKSMNNFYGWVFDYTDCLRSGHCIRPLYTAVGSRLKYYAIFTKKNSIRMPSTAPLLVIFPVTRYPLTIPV